MRSLLKKIALAGLGVVLVWIIVVAFWVDDTSVRQWGPFTGTVVDADTGQPIQGAIFMVTWMRAMPPFLHNEQMFDDARLAVADREGRFEIPRREPPYFASVVMGVLLACMAPGYEAYSRGREAQEPIVHMRRLKTERSSESRSSDLLSIPEAKRRQLTEQANEIRRTLGMRPVNLVSGLL
jgi:hypothetical protein